MDVMGVKSSCNLHLEKKDSAINDVINCTCDSPAWTLLIIMSPYSPSVPQEINESL